MPRSFDQYSRELFPAMFVDTHRLQIALQTAHATEEVPATIALHDRLLGTCDIDLPVNASSLAALALGFFDDAGLEIVADDTVPVPSV